ncbi:hypothetical protein RN001_004489 [Aquatica leii]|uniref:DUF4455 domain-containing protein n=1 Tax=Aquatica leii TaxID=1421715 RepID=A0AAN7P5E5_9COLE|nr:hypothetical protein RN001_004489 [Aquatica leii]
MLHCQDADDLDDDTCDEVPCYKFEVKDSLVLTKSTVFTPCQKKKCERKVKCHLPPLKKILSRKEAEINEVQCLPSDWTTISKPSKILQDLGTKKKLQHESVIQEVLNRCQIINQDIEAQIRLKSESIKEDLNEKEEKILKLMKTIEFSIEEPTNLKSYDFEQIEENILKIVDTSRFSVNEFYCDLQDLEKLRTQSFKKVLKYEYSELHKISYHLPYDLQKYFEEKILSINQIVLNNLRCYADLQQNLLIQIENKNKIHFQQFNNIYSTWKHIKKKELLIKLNQMTLLRSEVEVAMLNSGQGQTTSSMFLRKEQDMEQMISLKSPLPLTTSQVDVWSKSTQETIDSLDYCARKLMSLYKLAVVQVFNGYFEQLEHVRDEMGRGSLIDSEELNLLNLEICKPTIESVTRQYSNELFKLEDEWGSVITKLQHKLKTTYVFLRHAGTVWDDHFDRIKDLKSIILQDLQALIAQNDKWQNVHEMELAVAIDSLRQAHSPSYLDALLKTAFKKIDDMQNIYQAHYTSEIKILEKYEEMVELESEVLLAELQQSLHLFPKVGVRKQSLEVPLQSTRSVDNVCILEEEKNTFKHFLLKRTLQLEVQIEAVENWMIGLQEGIDGYITSCKYNNQRQANKWISENRKRLAKRLEVKLAVNNSKYERIKCSVYDVRLSELRMHSTRIDRHKAGAEQEINNIKKYFLSVQIRYNLVLTEYRIKVQSILSKMQVASNTCKVRTLIKVLNYNTVICKQKVSDLFHTLDIVLRAKVAKIKKTSITFCTKMKLFYEGGNFNPDEAKHICKDLKKLEKQFKKSLKSIKKDIIKKQKVIQTDIKKDEAKILPILTQSLEEFQFNDMIIAIIQNLQVDLKNETYKLKFFIKKTEDQLQNVKQISELNDGKMQSLNLFETEFKKLFEDFLKLSNNLYHTPPENNVRELKYPHIQVGSAASSKKSPKKSKPAKSTKSLKSSSKLTLSSYYDYAKMLFEHKPVNLDSFMPQICAYLIESLKSIQSESKDFYKKHPNIINKNLIRPSYDDLMREATEKYNFYFLQCELFWLHTVNDFFKMVQVAHEISAGYLSPFLDNYHKNKMDKQQKEHEEFQEILLTMTNTQIQNLSAVRKKLKPLHGYKDNRHLLDELIHQMEHTLQENKTVNFYTEYQNPYQEKIQDNLVDYIKNCKTLKDTMAGLQKDCTVELLNNPLLSQFEQRINYFEEFLKKMKEESEYCTTELFKAFYDKLKCLEIPSEFNLNTNNTRTIQRIVDFEAIQDEGAIDYDNYLEIYEEDCKLKLTDVYNIEQNWLQETDAEEKIFYNDVKIILQLYVVKYDDT